ncbi:DHDDS synthase, partial [Acromyrmex heyeri]
MSWLKERILNWFQFLVLKVIKINKVPKHVAFIMDGNRRYAKKQNLTIAEGYSKGYDKMIEMIYLCRNLDIIEFTIYAFSIENFKRSKEEVDGLMNLARQKFKDLLEDKKKLKDNGICIRVFGNLSLLPEDIYKLIAEVMIVTRENNRIFINFAIAYTFRRHGTGCSPHKNRHRLRYSKFNESCLVLVDLLVSKRHHYTLTNSHGRYWNDGTAHGPDTFEIPE